ncbi:hypothetical protein [Kibdelosporangium phytohabitans]|uniref:Uncharacterized protein n=1 Tax=Kibdelosporangium phytohabitans TaxID=860235 RepID=A0A0N9IBW9_9PSEU|nr:hypothetical protein [Kibdelosporangium phytohabitans]ALG12393.1 hypothetical protein AOZ06_40990 [Kibdelosporangium phytohabitans]MBE1463973.1 putative RNA-binding Zn-ribbon protein involved in translation (DUF1610 family) [Kibdelosporangium phytohabitans]
MPSAYFVAALKCPACGTTSPADESTELVTPLADSGFWTVGESDPDFTWRAIRVHYPVLREPAAGEPIQLLATWTCPACGSVGWARITFEDTVISAIAAVPLDVPTVSAAHAIDEDVAQSYERLTGEQLFPGGDIHIEFRARLLAALTQGGVSGHAASSSA